MENKYIFVLAISKIGMGSVMTAGCLILIVADLASESRFDELPVLKPVLDEPVLVVPDCPLSAMDLGVEMTTQGFTDLEGFFEKSEGSSDC